MHGTTTPGTAPVRALRGSGAGPLDARPDDDGAPDITEGALFFLSARVSPGWFSSRPRVGTFGGNVFYR